ncbi:MFS transporter [Microlunatus endophyticus]|uniref:MFS transporter n=1 Tax=Microlunatus endophyticus TaxID=1716077 RepID=A0A917S2L7_9ACTN|nr:MFS transporter [Microlunatus endophyticus]GGL53360.1 MFS transporter [Microlunatus endophyticus]
MIRSSRRPARPTRRNLNRLWFAQSTSLVGLQTGSVAVPLLAVDVLHADASQVALIGTVSSLPWLVAPLIGTIADRTRRKRLLVTSHLGRAGLWLTIPAAYAIGRLTMQQVWIVSALAGLLGVVFAVGHRAFLPTILAAEDLGAANGRMGGTDAAARATGPALAGYLTQFVGAIWSVVVQVAASVLAGIATVGIRPDQPGSYEPDDDHRISTRTTWWRGIVDGFRCVYEIKPLRWLAIVETGYLFFFDLVFAIVVVFFRNTLGLGAAAIGVIFSAGSLGGVLAALMTNRIRVRIGLDRSIKITAILRGVAIAVFPLSLLVPGHIGVIAVLVGGRGVNACAWSVYEVLSDTYQQTRLPEEKRGSAIAAILWAGNLAATVGSAGAAALATTLDPTALLSAAGVGAVVAGCLSLMISTGAPDGPATPRLRRTHRDRLG